MISKAFKTAVVVALLTASTLAVCGCASGLLAKAPPATDDRWRDTAGGLPQS